jgi:hypothetical protein
LGRYDCDYFLAYDEDYEFVLCFDC